MLLKNVVWTSFAIGMIATGSAFASSSTGSGSAATISDRDDVKFECSFRCEDDGKGGDDHDKCEAKGQLDPRKLRDDNWVLGDHDDYLRIRCDDDHDNQPADDDKNGILYGRHHDDLFITGDKTTAPLIIVEDVRKLEGKFDAKIIIRKGRDSEKLKGECVFKKKGDDDSAAPAPAPLN